MNLLEMMDCEYVAAVYSGNKEADHKANTEMYLKLVREGEERGFCPVLIEKERMYGVNSSKYGFTDSKEDYPKTTKRLIEIAEDSCFSVWMGRIIYNNYLDGCTREEDVKDRLAMLNVPKNKDYINRFKHPVKSKAFSFELDERYRPWNFTYENHVFALIPTRKPWEALAWIPFGGFNWCPDEVHQIALAKGLYDQFGARIKYIGFSSLEYYIPDALTSREAVQTASKILIAADNDVYEDYEVAADRILGSCNWSMWWD